MSLLFFASFLKIIICFLSSYVFFGYFSCFLFSFANEHICTFFFLFSPFFSCQDFHLYFYCPCRTILCCFIFLFFANKYICTFFFLFSPIFSYQDVHLHFYSPRRTPYTQHSFLFLQINLFILFFFSFFPFFSCQDVHLHLYCPRRTFPFNLLFPCFSVLPQTKAKIL